MTSELSGSPHLYLARHGQTALNAEGRLRGLADPPLDYAGILEADKLAEALIIHAPFLVYSSPLLRARTTARTIAGLAGVANHPDKRFNDRDYGPQTGRLKSEVVAEWGSVDAAPGVEPASDVLTRALPALRSVMTEAAGISVVVVTHDAVIRPLIEAIDPARTDLTVPTGSWNDLTWSDGEWTVIAVDQKPT